MSRIVDAILKNKLEYMGTVVIEGPKWCGKSTTAKQFSRSVIELEDFDKENQYNNVKIEKTRVLLTGSAKPVENGIMHTGTGRISKLITYENNVTI